MVDKFATNARGAMLLLNLIQVTESISGSVVPLAMFQSLIKSRFKFIKALYKYIAFSTKFVNPSFFFNRMLICDSPTKLVARTNVWKENFFMKRMFNTMRFWLSQCSSHIHLSPLTTINCKQAL